MKTIKIPRKELADILGVQPMAISKYPKLKRKLMEDGLRFQKIVGDHEKLMKENEELKQQIESIKTDLKKDLQDTINKIL